MIPPDWLDRATNRIAPHIRRALLTNDAGLNIYSKRENQEVTGSFKLSGAFGLAAMLAYKVESPTVEMIPGGNIQPELHDILCRQYSEK